MNNKGLAAGQGLPGGKGMVLFRAMAASTSRINVIRHSQDPRKRKGAIAAVVGSVALGILCAGMVGAMTYGMAYVGFAQIVPLLAAVIISVVSLIFTMFKSNGYLYAFKDYDLLMAMPFSVRSIVASRFLLMYLQDLPWDVLISLSALAGYALHVHPTAWVYVSWIVLTPLIPLLPTVVAALLGVLIARIGSRSRHKTLIQTILTFVFVIPMLFIQYLVRYFVKSDQVESVIATSTQTLEGISRVIPTVGWFGRAVNDGDVPSFVLMVLVSLGLYAGLVAFMSKSYRRINSRLASSSSHHNAKKGAKSYRQRSAVQSIAFKEFKRIAGSTVCATNLGLGAVFCLLLCVILPFVDLSAVIDMMSQGATVDGPPIKLDLAPLRLAWPVCVYFFVGMMPTTTSSPSLEGKNYWIIKSLPFDGMTVCKGRMLFNLYLNLVPGLLTVVMGLVAMRASWLELLLGALMICVMCLFSTVYGMRCGLKHQRLDWENEVDAVKKGSAVSLYLLPNMFSTMAIASLMFAAGVFGVAAIGALAIIAVYGVLTLACWRSVRRLAEAC